MVTMMKEKIHINNVFRDTGEVLNNTKKSFREKEEGSWKCKYNSYKNRKIFGRKVKSYVSGK